jgi:C-terminal processing protease CtpA/Prc
MIRSVLGRALLVAIGAAAAGLVIRWRAGTEPVPSEPGAPRSQVASARASSGVGTAAEGAYQGDIERRLKRLDARLAAGSPPAAPEAPAQADANAPAAGGNAGSAMERALAAAGLDPATVADIKRRDDESAMAEINLRNRATREQWLDSPRFNAEMAAIEAQRTPLRDEIGDDAYDRYLFALGETNRVRVDDVLEQSPAAQAGLQTGDLIVRYGDARLFNPSELVNQTRSGTEGEAVQLEIIRDGQRLEVQVPRGPLGLRVAATQGNPETS